MLFCRSSSEPVAYASAGLGVGLGLRTVASLTPAVCVITPRRMRALKSPQPTLWNTGKASTATQLNSNSGRVDRRPVGRRGVQRADRVHRDRARGGSEWHRTLDLVANVVGIDAVDDVAVVVLVVHWAGE